MTFVCLWIPGWSTGAASSAETGAAPPADRLTEALLRVAPRVALAESGLLWADARGLAARPLAEALCDVLRGLGAAGVWVGIARTAIAAEVAARCGDQSAVITTIASGQDRSFLAPHPIRVLCVACDPDPALLPLLAGVGIERCGDLAELGREEVEVRFGSDGVRLWRLARADDHRRPFGRRPRTLPRASCAWTDYALRDTERMLFVIHRLLGHVCEALQARGEGARELTLRFALANRSAIEHPLQAAHPTADRAAWVRLMRTALERLRLPDAVTGIAVCVGVAVPIHDPQGDMFDRGFATARATERAVAQLLDTCGADVVSLAATDHPVLERRMQWRVREPVALDGPYAAAAVRPSLTVQLLPEPQPVTVVTVPRRDHEVPVRYHEPAHAAAVDILVAAGPDRIDGGSWDATPYLREYYHCITIDGRLVLLFRTADTWYLHGWWD